MFGFTDWREGSSPSFMQVVALGRVLWDYLRIILVEDQSRNSGENVALTRQLLESNGLLLRRAICVQKPYLERRVHLTLQKQWPSCDFLLSSPPIAYEGYAQPDIIGLDKLVNELVGQVDRVERYPQRGFTEKTNIPEEVIAAKRQLVELGFANHLVSQVARLSTNSPRNSGA